MHYFSPMQLACKFTIILLFLVNGTLFGQSPAIDVDYVKENYELALEDEAIAKELFTMLSNANSKDPLIISYTGGIHAIMCLYTSNPIKQMKMVKKANALLNQAVALDGSCPEVRFMRLAFQTKVPKLLGFSKHIDGDKAFILQQLKVMEITAEEKQDIVDFMLEEDICTENEVQELQTSFKQ